MSVGSIETSYRCEKINQNLEIKKKEAKEKAKKMAEERATELASYDP